MPTIYVIHPGSSIDVHSRYLQVFHKQQLCLGVPINRVTQIILFGICNLSRKTQVLIATRRIPVYYINVHGDQLGSLELTPQRPFKYQTHQLICSQDFEFVRAIAESIIGAKLHNEMIVLKQLQPEFDHCNIEKTINFLQLLADDLPSANSIEELWDYHATATSYYYPILASLVPHWSNHHSSFRLDLSHPVLQMLKLGYTFLHQQMALFINDLDLDPQISNLHPLSQTNQPLVDDLIEEFRPILVDSLVVKLLQTGTITASDFVPPNGNRGGYLQPAALQTFINHWEEKLGTHIQHPLAGTISYRQCFELQVKEYIACLLGDVEFYQPLLMQKEKGKIQKMYTQEYLTQKNVVQVFSGKD